MRKRKAKRVELNQSALFKVPSPQKLAYLLKEDLGLLNALAGFEKNYLEWDSDGRWLENPKPALKRIQIRFAYLLSQIETPDYLHSAVKGRSYITNAKEHSAKNASIKLDVKKFYPSARSAEVFRFLHEDLQWPRDVAGLGRALLTWRGHLPTGGNASPILSFWSYKPMFDTLNALAENNGCVFTVYVDDMTLTGEIASRKMLHEARQIVGAQRLKAHKTHYFAAGRPRVITGVAQTLAGMQLPRRRQKLISDAEASLQAATSDQEKLSILTPLIGRVCEAAEIDSKGWNNKSRQIIRARREIDHRLRALPLFTPATLPMLTADEDDGSAPF